MIHTTNYDPNDRAAWEALRSQFRRSGVGGSEMGSVANLPGAFSSAYATYCDILGLTPPRDRTSWYLQDGRDLEDIVVRRFEQASGFKTRHRYAILQNSDYPHLFANVDRFVDSEDAGFEAKTYDVRSAKFDNGNVPAPYIAQVTVDLAVTQKKRWYLSAWAYGAGTKHFFFTTDPSDTKPDWCDAMCVIPTSEFKRCEEIAADFVMRLSSNVPPPVIGSEADEEAVRAVNPVETAGKSCDLGAVDGDLDRIAELDAQIESLEQEKEQHRQAVMQFLGDAEKGESQRWKATFKTTVAKRLDSKAAKAALGDALDPFYTESSSRTLRLRRVG